MSLAPPKTLPHRRGKKIKKYLKKPTAITNLAIMVVGVSAFVGLLTQSEIMFKVMLFTTVIMAIMVKFLEWELYNSRRTHRHCVPAGVGIEIFSEPQPVMATPEVPRKLIVIERPSRNQASPEAGLPVEQEASQALPPTEMTLSKAEAAPSKGTKSKIKKVAPSKVNKNKTTKKPTSKKLVVAGHWTYGDYELKRTPNVSGSPWLVTDSKDAELGSGKTLKEAQAIVDNLTS